MRWVDWDSSSLRPENPLVVHPGFAWEEVHTAAVEVGGGLDGFGVAEASGAAFDRHDLVIEHVVHRLRGQLQDVKTVMHNLLPGQRNPLFRRLHVGRDHVQRNRCNGRDLLRRQRGQAGDAAVGVVAVADRLDRAAIEVVQQRDVIMPFGERFLIESDPRQRLRLFPRLAPRHGPLDDPQV